MIALINEKGDRERDRKNHSETEYKTNFMRFIQLRIYILQFKNIVYKLQLSITSADKTMLMLNF